MYLKLCLVKVLPCNYLSYQLKLLAKPSLFNNFPLSFYNCLYIIFKLRIFQSTIHWLQVQSFCLICWFKSSSCGTHRIELAVYNSIPQDCPKVKKYSLASMGVSFKKILPLATGNDYPYPQIIILIKKLQTIFDC